MEWKKIASIEYGKIVFHSIPYHALPTAVKEEFIAFTSVSYHNTRLQKKRKYYRYLLRAKTSNGQKTLWFRGTKFSPHWLEQLASHAKMYVPQQQAVLFHPVNLNSLHKTHKMIACKIGHKMQVRGSSMLINSQKFWTSLDPGKIKKRTTYSNSYLIKHTMLNQNHENFFGKKANGVCCSLLWFIFHLTYCVYQSKTWETT